MQPMQRADNVPPPRQQFIKACQQKGATKAEAQKIYRELKSQETWKNNLYVVSIDRDVKHGMGMDTTMFEITIRRVDREPGLPFRDVQAIKNQLVNPESEMCEVYPAESRLVDTANQYWFYGFNDPEIRFPWGFTARAVSYDNPDFLNAKQLPG